MPKTSLCSIICIFDPMHEHKTILWDWNGTLLNDIRICIDAINVLLRERELEELYEDRYREIFTFPVRKYYEKAGFDFSKEDFSIPAIGFIEQYDALVRNCGLFMEAKNTLETFRKRNYTQVILSAMQHDFLNKLVKENGISHYFSAISGIEDHYAEGKVENAKKLLEKLDGNAAEAILIGDTLHDHEVGQELGLRVILVAWGHQSLERIQASGREIAHSFEELSRII